ncbi:ParB/RepB/Spo0J family partition protein [Cochlodiniinecator piscidefendens]|uniref:ParB/RepB/Spo0J family partition protein n=1 Tax=Cochlodiniinecator piscidefendens TaxID=2715756 RepID=UPI00140BAAB1|nr:ParB N-terminal domain-containing protein [Cochlodiniinecator piscidefendens]
MAKRRRLSAPDADALRALNDSFDEMPELETKSMVPPIAQVAADAAGEMAVSRVETRVENAQDKADAERLRKADREGLLVQEILLGDIAADHLSRDRVMLDAEQMEELKSSIRQHGQRTPIEIMRTDDGFGLISGWRRLKAIGELFVETGSESFSHIRAFIREPESAPDAYVSMVEENEIRADLSQYERGRVAAVSTAQGVFASVEAAVDALFASASKAKRSKIRSFAAIHDALGDLLSFPGALSERTGLQLASALRARGGSEFRAVLAESAPQNPAEEWTILEAVITQAAVKKDKSRGGRPTREATKIAPIELASGGEISGALFEDRLVIELKGQEITPIVAREMLERLRNLANNN